MADESYVALFVPDLVPLATAVCEEVQARWLELSNLKLMLCNELYEKIFLHPHCIGWAGFLAKPELQVTAKRSAVPVINFSNRLGATPDAYNVFADDVEIGSLAAQHLLEKGYRQFIFFGSEAEAYSRERRSGFRAAVETAGGSVYMQDPFVPAGSGPLEFLESRRALAGAILRKINGPTGVLAGNDELAAKLLEDAPESERDKLPMLGLVGVDNGPLCQGNGEIPPFTSIEQNVRGIGRAVAEALHRAVTGKAFEPGGVERIGGARVVERESTGGLPTDDIFVARVIRDIHRQVEAGEAPGVEELSRNYGISPSALLHRFKSRTGQTLREYQMAVRMHRAAALLRDTEFPIVQISLACGFSKHSAFSNYFAKTFGRTPTEYRKQAD
jgi:LacI family transcriptional regulator